MDQQTYSVDGGVRGDAQVEAIRIEVRAGLPKPSYPALVYRGAFGLPPAAAGRATTAAARSAYIIETTFALHGWTESWCDGVYEFHHYHSTAHEVLGCCAGRATLQLGGPDGPQVSIARGDVLVLPAGTAHKCLTATDDFAVVGAYDRGRDYDMQLEDASTRKDAERNIARVPLPAFDPVYGGHGPLLRAWRERPSMIGHA